MTFVLEAAIFFVLSDEKVAGLGGYRLMGSTAYIDLIYIFLILLPK